jgi:hypothetical protein
VDPDRDTELALTERVGRELARLGLHTHVGRMRAYFAAVRAGRPSEAWSHDLSVEWLRLLRLPPYETDYPVRDRMASCGRCETSSVFTATVFPGGSKHRCGSCGAQWLALDDAGG